MKPFTNLEAARSFHGHLGPCLVIGIRIGNRALAALEPKSCFQLKAEVRCAAEPPISCVIDGIQLSTGCTMGKRNISHTIQNGVEAVFTEMDTNKSISIRVKDDFIQRAIQWMKELGEEEASLKTWNAEDNAVFLIHTS